MATAFRPVLPSMLAATYARGGQTEEVHALTLRRRIRKAHMLLPA